MPYLLRILLENMLRQDDPAVVEAGRNALLAGLETGRSEAETPFSPTASSCTTPPAARR